MKNRIMSRPTIMTPKTIDKLRQAFMMGCSDREACVYANIANQTLYSYQQKHSEFLEQKVTYKTNPLLKARKTIFDNLNEVKTAQWYLERKANQEFNLQPSVVSVTENEDNTLVNEDVVDENLINKLENLLIECKKENTIRIGKRIGLGGVILK